MGAPDNASTADVIAPQDEAAPLLNATYNPRDVTIGPASGQDAAALWGVKASADVDAGQDGNGAPPDRSAAAPANSHAADNTGGAENTDSAAAYDAAAQRVKTQNAQTCSQAALMLSAQGGAPVPDQALADYFHVSLPVVSENREQFRNAYNRNESWRALSQCSVLPGFVVAHPQAAPAVKHDLLSWSTLEGLFSESAHNLEEGAGAIAEPILHHGTGLIASPLSHVAGLGATAYEAWLSDEDNSQEIDGFVRHVRDSWTYQPRTEAGASPVNPLNSIPTWFGMLLKFALPDKAEDGDTASGMFRNGIREAIPQALGIVGPKLPFIPKALREGDASGIEGEGQAVPNPDLPPAGGDVPPPVVAHPAPKLAPSVQADLTRSVRTASIVDRVSQLLKGNRLCQENPALCSKAVQEMASQGDMRTLYVPRDAFEQVAQSRGMTSQTLLERMPETQAKGGLLAIPAQEYFTALPEGMAGDLSAFVKIDPARGSLAEVLARAKKEPLSADGADVEAPPDSQTAAPAESDADAANAAGDTQPGDGQATAAAQTGHPLLDAEQWAKYQEELQGMSPENRAIAERFADKLRDYPAAVAEYAQLNDSQGGKLLNTDFARELSEDYLKDRTKAEVVQRLASAFVRKMYADKLAATKEPMVIFSAGGPGAGKSTALAKVPALAQASAKADIIYDTTMSHYGSAKEMIEQALQVNGFVDVVLVIREPGDALLNGVIRRAVDEEKEFGSGRTVTLDYFLEAHPAAIQNVFRLAEEYRNNADVNFRFVDNTHGLGRQREVSLEQAKQIEFRQVEERAREILEQEYRDGRISEKIYTGIKFGKGVP